MSLTLCQFFAHLTQLFYLLRGNMGGGATQIIMPALAAGIAASGASSFSSWRWSFFVPGAVFILMGILTLMYARDSPLGDYRDLKKNGVLASGKGNLSSTLKCALGNYRTWILAITYGYSFGVELTVDNIIVSYLYDQVGGDLIECKKYLLRKIPVTL